MADTKKLKSDTKLLKDARYLDEVRDMISYLGADPDKILKEEIDETIPILMEAKSLVDKASGGELFEKNVDGLWKIYDKISAITIMIASLGIKEDLGLPPGTQEKEATPYFSGVSRWLGIPRKTLEYWWASRDSIYREQAGLAYSAVQRTTLKQIFLIEKFTDGLDKVDLKDMAKTPKGVAAMSMVLTKLIFIVKLLNEQGHLISNAGAAVTAETKRLTEKVGLVLPNPTTIIGE